MAWPTTGQGSLSVRLRKTDSGNVPVIISLLQGDAVIVSQVATLGTAYATQTIVLAQADLAGITDFTNLRLQVTAGSPTVACCPNALPATLYATFSGAVPQPGQPTSCVCLNGLTVTLLWNGTNWKGAARTSCPGFPVITVTFSCFGGHQYSLNANCGGSANQNQGIYNCNPISVSFQAYVVSGCCAPGSVNITVTQ
jgi:hypothetical protein